MPTGGAGGGAVRGGPGPLPWLVLPAALSQMTKVGSEEHRQASTAISVVSIVGVVIHDSVFLSY